MDFKKPRISIWYYVVPQTGYRNDGAPLFMSIALRRLLNGDTLEDLNKGSIASDAGNVVHIQPNEPIKPHGKFDLNILIDHGEDTIGVPLDFEVPHPNVYWAFDTHIDEKGYKYRLERARQFDHVFLCHKAQISDFIRDGIDPQKIHYLPCGVDVDCYKPYPIIEKWNWAFIGFLHSEFRVDLVDRFCKEWPLGSEGYLGWRIPQFQGHCVLDDTAKKFSMSRILLNTSIKNDLNLRTFEAMACGKMLLTQDNEPLHEFFEDGVHLRTFKTVDEAVSIAKEMLLDSGTRNTIARVGREELLSKHTWMHRLKEMLKISIDYEPQELIKA